MVILFLLCELASDWLCPSNNSWFSRHLIFIFYINFSFNFLQNHSYFDFVQSNNLNMANLSIIFVLLIRKSFSFFEEPAVDIHWIGGRFLLQIETRLVCGQPEDKPLTFISGSHVLLKGLVCKPFDAYLLWELSYHKSQLKSSKVVLTASSK